MKTLTLTQPWATLVILGNKTVETRGWRTPYRGRIAIHAAKNWTMDDRDFAWDLYKRGYLSPDVAHGIQPTDSPDHLPLGMVLGTVEMVDCVAVETLGPMLTTAERTFGDYSPGRWGWVLAKPEPIEPVAARGMLGLWEWDGA